MLFLRAPPLASAFFVQIEHSIQYLQYAKFLELQACVSLRFSRICIFSALQYSTLSYTVHSVRYTLGIRLDFKYIRVYFVRPRFLSQFCVQYISIEVSAALFTVAS